ncbi:putative membrane protein [Sesbania bispinosa]|nr:putative membrane protein [Sesbania bispinosa]
MEPPTGFCASLLTFIRFLPFFIGLLILGNLKGVIFCPLVCAIITIGNSLIMVGLWPVHFVWTYYCVVRTKQLGPFVKLLICTCVLPVLVSFWPVVVIIGSLVGGALYGYLSPTFATFEAIKGEKDDKLYHCFIDGTWSTIQGSCMAVRDVKDVCFYSYFSVMDDLLQKGPPDTKYYEIRLLDLPGAFTAAFIGILVDVPGISFVALLKAPYMLFRGWQRLFQDLIGREGPFLETICVPFAGLAILLWPLAVFLAILASMLASFLFGAYAAVVAYQESSFVLGLRYVVAALSIYDEYINDILYMPEGTCFPRPHYRRKVDRADSVSISRPSSFRKAPSRTSSMKTNIAELKSLELLDALFKESCRVGEKMISEGLITGKDIEEAKYSKGSNVITIGLPAYCLLQGLLRSAKVNSDGILISDDTELTTTNRPRDKFFDWFFNPLLIMKEQIKAENLSASEEDYLCKLVLLSGDAERLKKSSIGPAPESEVKRAELDALARRLQGITKSMTRFPTFKRRFDDLVKALSNDHAEKHGAPTMTRSKSAYARLMNLKSFKGTGTNGSGQGSEHARDEENSR